MSFFRNENMILALNQMRTGNTDKALKYINRITHPQFMPRKQHAYIRPIRINKLFAGFMWVQLLAICLPLAAC